MTLGFEKAFLMQTPLNLSASQIIDTYVYKMGLASLLPNFSYSAASGLFQSVVAFGLVMLVNFISRKLTENSLW
jgi:ABC-type polysaccharide transport system permease subunit